MNAAFDIAAREQKDLRRYFMKYLKKIAAVGVSLIFALSLAACGGGTDAGGTDAGGTASAQSTAGISESKKELIDFPVVSANNLIGGIAAIAKAEGYFEEEGLNVSFTYLSTNSDVLTAVISGKVKLSTAGGGSVAPGYDVIDAKDITAPYDVPKAVTLQGVAYDGGKVVGIVELKLGKVSKGKSKISGSFTGLDGKKISIKAVTVTGIDGSAPVSVSLAVKGHGTMDVTIGGSRFAGSLGGKYHVQSAAVGGAWAGGTAKATVDIEIGDLARFPGTLLTDFLPDEERATVKNGKWTFAKAASVKWAKPKKGAEVSEYYDAAAGKDLVIDTSKGKTNLSGLKLTYTPKKGTFKGSFKVYALEGSGKKAKLKKYTVNVNGFVIDGVGYGKATLNKPAASWTVMVE